jgi:hypothetical protein
MATTFTKIASITVGSGGTTNINFTSIPSTYTDLVLLFTLRGNTGTYNQEFPIYLNNNGAGYTFRAITGTGAGVNSTSGSSTANAFGTGPSATSNTFSNGQLYIPNYTSSNYKSYSIDQVTENNGLDGFQTFRACIIFRHQSIP